MNVTVITDPSELQAVRAQLAELERFAELCTQSASWLVAAGQLHPKGDLRVFLVWDGDKLAAAATLARHSIRGARRYIIAGSHHHFEPTGLLYRDPQALLTLLTAITDSKYPLVLSRIPANQPWVAKLTDYRQWRVITSVRSDGACPVLPLHAGWAEPLSQLSSKRRSDLRRAYRRAREIGDVEVEILAPMTNVDEIISRAMRVEAKSWKGREGNALLNKQTRADFFRTFAQHASADGSLRVSFLRIDGNDAAMQIATVFQNAWWIYKIGYDETFARCSPGVILISETISKAASEGIKSFEFLGKSEPWISMWTKEQRPIMTIRTYPMSFRGLMALAIDSMNKTNAMIARKIKLPRTRSVLAGRQLGT